MKMKPLTIFKKLSRDPCNFHVKMHAMFQYIVVSIMCNFFIWFWTQNPHDLLSLHLRTTQEACLWDTTVYISSVPSAHTSQLVALILHIWYQPGRCPVLNQSSPTAWMPEPIPVANCPPGLEYLLAQVLHTNPKYFLMKYELGDPTKKDTRWIQWIKVVGLWWQRSTCETIGAVILISDMWRGSKSIGIFSVGRVGLS